MVRLSVSISEAPKLCHYYGLTRFWRWNLRFNNSHQGSGSMSLTNMKSRRFSFMRCILTLSLYLEVVGHSQIFPSFSDIGLTPAGSSMVSSDSWIGQFFLTGTNTAGYLLNSVQMRMENQAGNPAGFTLSIYSSTFSAPTPPRVIQPGVNLEILSGDNPTTAGVYSFSSTGLHLTNQTAYYLVATATTPSSTGAFLWDYTNEQPTPGLERMTTGTGFSYSTDGISWQFSRQHYYQFAINVTAVPEPSSLCLLGLGASFLFTRLARKFRSKALSQP